MSYTLLQGDAIEVLRTLPAESVQCVVTSPPYFGLRDYGTATWEGGDVACDHVANAAMTKTFGNPDFNGTRPSREATKIDGYYFKGTCGKCGARRIDQQIGLEETPDAYVAKLVAVFREVRRVLHPTGVVFLNLGDSYAAGKAGRTDYGTGDPTSTLGPLHNGLPNNTRPGEVIIRKAPPGLKPKDLIGIPWMTAFALRADGWYLRSEIIWHKRAPMPESVTDRPTKAHEQVFLLAKNANYFYDAEAIAEPATQPVGIARLTGQHKRIELQSLASSNLGTNQGESTRNKRSVWTLGPESFDGAHFATMPTKLVEPCILAGSSARGCCAKCKAPYERVVEREKVGQLRPMTESGGVHPQSNYRTHAENGRITDPTSTLNHLYSNTTVDWRPSCTCNAGVEPCVVLDPFCGSGTVVAVALKHHRNGIGIDLNESYISLAHERIARSQPLLLDVTG